MAVAWVSSQPALAQTVYTLSTLTSGNAWTNAALWTPASTAGPGNTPGVSNDTATLPLGALTAGWNMSLNSSPVLSRLAVTASGNYDVTLNAGSPAGTLTLSGPTPLISSGVAGGRTLILNPTLNLTTANAMFTNAGGGNLYLVNPGTNFFPWLHPAGGLNVATSLRIGNVSRGVAPLSRLKTGAGSLQLDLSPGSTFFTNQASIGGLGIRTITGVGSVANAAGQPQVLINESDDYLDLELDGTMPSTNFFRSLAGISAAAGQAGDWHIEYVRGTNNLGAAVFDTSAANNDLNFYGHNSGAPASAVLNGGSFNVGSGTLGLHGGITLNVDSNTGQFSVGFLLLSSANGGYFYRGGAATVNWNASGKTVGSISFSSQGGGPATLNLLGGALSPIGDLTLGPSGHDYDDSRSYLNVYGGTLTVAAGSSLSLSPVTTSGAREYSYLTITNAGVMELVPGSSFKVGARSSANDTKDSLSEVTVNLDGGTLRLGTAVARQAVSPTTHANGSAKVLFYFNGGTLQAAANLSETFAGFSTPNSTGDAIQIKSRGAILDTAAFNLGISNNLAPALTSTGGLAKLGPGTLRLSGSNTYTGPTLVSAGRLVLDAGASLGKSSQISLATGTSLDVTALPTFALTASNTLAASGAGQAAVIYGAAAGGVNFGSRPITLSFDGSNPALRIAQGALTLAGQTITVNTPNPLANGTYDLIHVAGGVINSSGSFTLAGNAGAGSISVSGGLVRMTITGSSRVRTTTTLSGSETIYYRSAASIQATVSPAVASGTVQFYLDGTPFGSPVAMVGGLAALPSVAGLTGIHSISATYSGSGLHAPSGSTAPVTLTINPYPSDGTVTAADEADAFEIQLLSQQTRYPDNYYLEQPTDDAAMGASVANLQANGRFANITYPANPNSTVIDEGGGWGWSTCRGSAPCSRRSSRPARLIICRTTLRCGLRCCRAWLPPPPPTRRRRGTLPTNGTTSTLTPT